MLNPSDIQLISNKEVILQKNRIIESIELQLNKLGKQSLELRPKLAQHSKLPKVSKGEKQAGLPFLVLDFPRNFTTKDVFAIRTLVWWGKGIFFILHLKGKYLEASKAKLAKRLRGNQFNNAYISIQGNEWEHDTSNDDYKKLETFQASVLDDCAFFKLVFKFPLERLNDLNELHLEFFNFFSNLTPYESD